MKTDAVIGGPFAKGSAYRQQVVITGGTKVFDIHFDYGHDDACRLQVFIAEAQLADGFDTSYLKVLGIVAIINDVHLVCLRVPDADGCFAAIHLFYVLGTDIYFPIIPSTLTLPGPTISTAKKPVR